MREIKFSSDVNWKTILGKDQNNKEVKLTRDEFFVSYKIAMKSAINRFIIDNPGAR